MGNLRQINLMGPNPAQPFDLQTRQAALAQESAIAQALIAKSLQDHAPTIRGPAGNPYARDVINVGGPLGNIIDAYMGKAAQEKVNQGQSELAQEYQRRTLADTAAMMDARQGVPGQVDSEGGPFVPGTAPSFLKAIRVALGSSVPEVRAQGMAMLKQMPSPEDLLKAGPHFTSESLQEFATDPNASVLKQRPQMHFADGVATPYADGKIGTSQATESFSNAEIDPATGLSIYKSNITNKPHALTGGNVTPNRAASISEAEATVAELKKGMEGYRKDVSTLSNIVQAEYELSKLPEDKMGVLSWFRNNFTKFGELIGAEKLVSTGGLEALHSALGNLTLEKVRALAPVTENDVTMIQSIVGSESNTKRALEKIMQVLATATARSMGYHRDFVTGAANTTFKGMVDPGEFLQKWAPDFRIDPVQGGGAVSGNRRVKYSDLPDQ